MVNFINKKFPDLRSIFVELQGFKETGEFSSVSNVSNKLKIDLYNLLYDKNMDYELIFHFLSSNFGAEKIDQVFKLLGRSFVDWSINEKKENIDKLFKLNYIISDLHFRLESNTDPLILGMTLIGKFRDILIEN